MSRGFTDGAGTLVPYLEDIVATLGSPGHVQLFAGSTWYVDGGIAVSGAGTSPDTAFKTIGEGLVAMSNGDRLAIKAATYDENALELAVDNGQLIAEHGTILSDSTGGTETLLVSGTACVVSGLSVSEGGQIGIKVTGQLCWIHKVNAFVCTTAFDIDGSGTVLTSVRAWLYATTGLNISVGSCVCNDSNFIGYGAATRGVYLSSASSQLNVFHNVNSAGNATAGYELVSGADSNIFNACASGNGDGAVVDPNSTTTWLPFPGEGVQGNHHEYVYPVSDGEGSAGNEITVSTDATDETNGAATSADYWGEPKLLIPLATITSLWKWIGFMFYGITTGKSISWESFTVGNISSAKNGGAAWDEGETALTVSDGSKFEADDLVWIYSTYKLDGELVLVDGAPAGDTVKIKREGSQFGAANIGLRWDHTTNAPGTEVMYLARRDNSVDHDVIEGGWACASAKDFTIERWHDPKLVLANSGLVIRSLNETDGTNNTRFGVKAIYED